MIRKIARALAALTILFAVTQPTAFGQAAGGVAADLTLLEGRTLRPAGQDDVRMLGIMGGSILRTAQQQGRATPELEAIVERAMAAAQGDRTTEAFRYATRAIALLQGAELTEGLEVATALDVRLDRKIVAPGDELQVEVDPLFTLDRPLEQTYTVHLAVYAGEERVVTLGPHPIRTIERFAAMLPTERFAAGYHVVMYELRDAAGERIVYGFRDFIVAPTVGKRVAALREQLERIRGTEWQDPRRRAAAETVEYFADLIGRATEEYVTVARKKMHAMTWYVRYMTSSEAGIQVYLRVAQGAEPFRLDEDLALVESLAEALLAGNDPFAERTGDLHLAHRSSIDHTLQPYRAFIPEGYNPAERYPLVIGLHGASGDENSFMGRQEFKGIAQDRGYLLATPNARGPFTGYQGNAGTDVLEVVDRMLAMYAIDPEQVFLTGHSMGGGGTWRVGFRAPDRFAALAPIAGGPPPTEIDLGSAPELPVLFSAGVKDRVVPIERLRRVAEVAGQKLKNFTYVEYPEDGHPEVPASAIVPIFDFFDSHRPE
jgi:predicted esterase